MNQARLATEPTAAPGANQPPSQPATQAATSLTSPNESSGSGIDPLPTGLLEPTQTTVANEPVQNPSITGVRDPSPSTIATAEDPLTAVQTKATNEATTLNNTEQASAPVATPPSNNPLNPFPDDMFAPQTKTDPAPNPTEPTKVAETPDLPELPETSSTSALRETNVDNRVAPAQAGLPSAESGLFPLPGAGNQPAPQPNASKVELPPLPELGATVEDLPALPNTNAKDRAPSPVGAKSEDDDLPPLPPIELPPLPKEYQTSAEPAAPSNEPKSTPDADLPTLPPPTLEPTPSSTEPTPNDPPAPSIDANGAPEISAPEASRQGRVDPNTAVAKTAESDSRTDPAIRRASYKLEADAKPEAAAAELDLDGEGDATLVRVGEEVITRRDLQDEYEAFVKNKKVPPAFIERNKHLIMKDVLKSLVQQTLLLQEAQRLVKNPKFIELIDEESDKIWRAEEMAEMIKREGVPNELELKRKLAERGVSLDDMRLKFRKRHLIEEMVHTTMRRKAKPTLGDALAYYNQHLQDFDRPEELTWSEIVVDESRFPNRESARKQADALLARLKKGEDFAALARKESNGATASDGGLWKNTSPDGYAIRVVNQALRKLKPGQLSEVLEDQVTFHIVRVESHRAAGPVPFEEVQNQVEMAVASEKIQVEFEQMIAEARKHTPVIPDVLAEDPIVKR